MTSKTSAAGTDSLADLAADAYVYGYPLVFDVSMISAFMHKGFGSLAPTPFNRFGHSTKLATPDAHFVSVNNDTVYSIAQVDLSGGPILLHVPDTAGAYYVLQFVDVWSNNFAYLGKRATGTEEGDWLVVPPGWSGTVPDKVRGVIEAPTAVVSVVGRNACDGPEDMPRVHALQQRLTLAPLDAATHPTGLPAPDPDVPEELRFYEQLRVWMADFPPAGPDQDYQERFQPLGLLEEGPSPYMNADPALVKALTEGLTAGKARVEAASKPRVDGDRPPGAWETNPHLFDYNLDHLGIGTVDAPQWKIADREASYLARAAAARAALWGNHGYEAVYAHTFTDSTGRRLNGSRSYTLRFEQPPPVESFWSVTMYDTPDYYLVANPAGRYSLGDRTPGLTYDKDGSLTVVIRRERPEDPVEAANWLPAPAGDFRPMIRLYTPRQSVLDGTYQLPPIVAKD
ncbi:DUF1254 domain-containing protein [Streptomyces aquilus]|uniref:DUF1254 domain-containing protein n=1 Tax=Streptomyces aquilus TaxID=2548456 RepID=A0A3S9HRU8_9ACTN|nr:DUF1254 domain-containing protein [Streptomyces aquilus]AZP14850.1 DUF1254 domain-containing protein [Streptomyces aquilus]